MKYKFLLFFALILTCVFDPLSSRGNELSILPPTTHALQDVTNSASFIRKCDLDPSYIYKMSICTLDHDTYGFTFPVTYSFSIPEGSGFLTAYKRYFVTDNWAEVQTRSSDELFSGIEAARFDYITNKAYISLPFSSASNDVYIKIVDQMGADVLISYLGIPEFYDNRRIAVNVTIDDIGEVPTWGGNDKFLEASQLFSNSKVWWTPAIETMGLDIDWTLYQTGVNYGYTEIASHSRSHAAPPYSDYDSEIEGSKVDIINNLTLPFSKDSQGYVWSWIEPYGFSDDTVSRKLGQYGYLVARQTHEVSGEDRATPWAEWHSLDRHYGRAWTSAYLDTSTLDDLNSIFDQVYTDGGIYHIWGHIGKNNWTSGGIAYNHIQHIKGRKDIWYVGFGQMYMYRYTQRVVTVSSWPSPVEEFSINANSDSNGSITPSGSITIDSHTSQTFFVSAHDGYHIDNVIVDGMSTGAVGSFTFTDIKANHIISATFAVDDFVTYTIAATTGANGWIVPSGDISVNSNSNLSFLLAPQKDYHVADVIVDGLSIGPVEYYTFSSINADHVISATFAADSPATFTITASTGDHGSVTPSGSVTVNANSSQTFQISANDGYHIVDVLVDGVSTGAAGSFTFTDINADHVISATFTADSPATFTITASTGDHGSVTPSGSVTVNANSSQTFQISANDGYHIVDVLVDGVSTEAAGSFTFTDINADHVISATFAADSPATFTITASTGDHGSVTPSGSVTVNANSSQTFQISANDGYHIVDVLVDGVSTGAAGSFTFTDINADHVISATFAADSATVINSSYSAGGMPYQLVEPGAVLLTPYTNYEGSFNLALALKSQDESIELSITKGVIAKTKEDSPLKAIKIDTTEDLTATFSQYQFISPVYILSPGGATFSPAITLTFFYNIAELPQDINLETLNIAVYNKDNCLWEICNSKHTKSALSVSTEIEQSNCYALVGMPTVLMTTEPPLMHTPAEFTVSGLKVNPDLASPGETILISAKVSNVSNTNGEYKIVLKIDNTLEMTRQVFVEAGSISTEEFSINRNNPGNYQVDINGLTSSFTIEQLPPLTPNYIQMPIQVKNDQGISRLTISIIIIALLVAGTLITLVQIIRRK